MISSWLGTVAGPAGAAEPSVDDYAPASMVGLEAEDVDEGARLTAALRRAFAARGLSGGKEAHLSELRLVLDCRTNTPSCLAKGGEVLQARRLIYGELRSVGEGRWELELSVLEVESATVAERQVFPLDAAALGSTRVNETAEQVAAQMLPEVDEPTAVEQGHAGALPPPPPPDPDREADGERSRGGLRWGYQRPTPRWKWAGFGASVGVLAVGAGGWLGTSIWLTSPDGGFRAQLLEAAQDSLREPDPLNRVDPMMSGDLCDYNARDDDGNPLVTETGQPGARNAEVAQVCIRGRTVVTIGRAFTVTTIVGLVSTAVFTTLLLVHRERPGKVARAWRRRGLQLGVEPTIAQGTTVRLGGRF